MGDDYLNLAGAELEAMPCKGKERGTDLWGQHWIPEGDLLMLVGAHSSARLETKGRKDLEAVPAQDVAGVLPAAPTGGKV